MRRELGVLQGGEEQREEEEEGDEGREGARGFSVIKKMMNKVFSAGGGGKGK